MYIYRFQGTVSVYDNVRGKSYKGIRWRSKDFAIFISERVQDVAQFVNGDSVTLQVELAYNGTTYTDHNIPWVRVPLPCHNAEFGKLRSMGVFVQWIDKTTNRWMNAPLQTTQTRKRTGDKFTVFISGMVLFSALTQTTYSNAPGWNVALDRTTIRPLRTYWLRQEAVLSATPVAGRVVEWPHNHSLERNKQKIIDMIPADLVGRIVIGARPDFAKKIKCDLCTSLADVSHFSNYNSA